MSTNLVDTGPTTVTWTWYVNGTATDVGSVTVTITDGNGTAVATAASTTNNADGTYTYSLAVQTNTTILKFEWTDGTSTQTDTMTVVGGWLYTEAAARAFDDSALTSVSKYPDADIAAIRQQVVVTKGALRVGAFLRHERAFQLLQPVGEDVCRDAFRGLLKFAVPFLAEDHVPDQRQRPLVAEEIEPAGNRAPGSLAFEFRLHGLSAGFIFHLFQP